LALASLTSGGRSVGIVIIIIIINKISKVVVLQLFAVFDDEDNVDLRNVGLPGSAATSGMLSPDTITVLLDQSGSNKEHLLVTRLSRKKL
jgi:hypothetical protein